jgi:hypothetical protein
LALFGNKVDLSKKKLYHVFLMYASSGSGFCDTNGAPPISVTSQDFYFPFETPVMPRLFLNPNLHLSTKFRTLPFSVTVHLPVYFYPPRIESGQLQDVAGVSATGAEESRESIDSSLIRFSGTGMSGIKSPDVDADQNSNGQTFYQAY